eukprot:gene36843-biopygen30226
MLAKGVWKPVDVNYLLEEEVTRIIHSSLFLKEKLTMDGEREKIKARFVAGGNEQDREFYGDISSPTVRTDSVLMIAVIAAWERRTVATMDIGANAKDDCVFNLNRDGYQCTACVHVDDVLLTCSNNYVLDCAILDINNLYKETT